jgi:hypothetical protein
VPTNIIAVGSFLHAFLNWFSTEDIGVSYMLVPANIVTAGWCLHEFIKKCFVVLYHLGFHVKPLCVVDYMFHINCLWMVD